MFDQEARSSWITALQPGSGRLSHDGDDSAAVYEQVHAWTRPQHEAVSHTPPANEYRPLGVRDQPSLYINVEEPKPTVTYTVPFNKQPIVPDIPVVIECGDSERVSTVPHPSPTFVGKATRNGKGDNSGQMTLGISQAANIGGFKTPSRVPEEFQQLNFQQIQILIEKLEALKDGSRPTPPEDPNIEDDEHLYDQIPEMERPIATKKYGNERRPEAKKPQLPLKPPRPKHERVEGSILGVKDERRGFPTVKPQTAPVKADNKPKKSLGK